LLLEFQSEESERSFEKDIQKKTRLSEENWRYNYHISQNIELDLKKKRVIRIYFHKLFDCNTMGQIYKANITVGGLFVPESRKIADLMLKDVSAEEWKKAVEVDNILQKLSVESTKRIANFIRARLELMTPELWEIIRDGNYTSATHATFSAAIKHSRILGDYLDLVIREQFRHLEDHLTSRLWDDFISGCKQRDPDMKFSERTINNLRRVIHSILFEVGYVKSTRTLELQKVSIEPDVMNYLKDKNEQYVLRCIQVC